MIRLVVSFSMSDEKKYKYFQVLKINPKAGDGTFPLLIGKIPLPGESMIDHIELRVMNRQ